ncbi:MAG: hypothetical protein Q8O91_07655 [Candidatus Aminicenantes bacterium]|nr:hypothetical protein [Candidatus Aminicenantes bacterium]
MRRKVGIVFLLIITIVLLFIATRSYLGSHYLDRYKALRAEAPSIERSFRALEAALKEAIGFSSDPVLFQELGRLYTERAMAELKYGLPEKRDLYLDLAQDAFARVIRLNPTDALAYYDLGQTWMFYNHPLLTYAEKGRFYYGKALEFKPMNESLNLNILFTFLTQWNGLTDEEKAFTFRKLRKMVDDVGDFASRLRRLWMENVKDEATLKEILAGDQALWEKIKGKF